MASLFTFPRQQAFDSSGDPLPGAKLFFYETGTTSPKDTYYDLNLNTPHTNPVVADQYGMFPIIWLDESAGLYRVKLTDSSNVQQWVEDNVSGELSQADVGAVLWPRTTAEVNAGVTPTNYYYEPGDVRRYGADATGAADSSAAIQAAFNVGGAVYFPRGTYDINTAITVTGYGRVIYGDGPELSIINLTSTNDGFVGTQSLIRVTFRDFGITGDASSGRGIYFDQTEPTEWTYQSLFENLDIYTGKQAIYLPASFSCVFVNVNGSSHTEHVFEIYGGPAVSFIGCYAHQVPANKAGYRIYGGASFVSCNGIDSPSNAGARWGFFGKAVTKGDATNVQYYTTFVNCNFEDFNDYGLQFRFDGNANFINCTWLAKGTGTYEASVFVEYNSKGMQFTNCTFSTNGATRNKLAYIYAETAAYATGLHGNFDGVDQAGTLINPASAIYGYPEFAEAAYKYRNIEVSRRAYLDEALLTGAAGSAAAGVIALGNATQTTVGAAGGASALPANPTGYIKCYLGATQIVIPYYAQA